MVTPPALLYGDKVGLVATARKISLKELKEGLDLIKSWGLIPV